MLKVGIMMLFTPAVRTWETMQRAEQLRADLRAKAVVPGG